VHGWGALLRVRLLTLERLVSVKDMMIVSPTGLNAPNCQAQNSLLGPLLNLRFSMAHADAEAKKPKPAQSANSGT